MPAGGSAGGRSPLSERPSTCRVRTGRSPRVAASARAAGRVALAQTRNGRRVVRGQPSPQGRADAPAPVLGVDDQGGDRTGLLRDRLGVADQLPGAADRGRGRARERRVPAAPVDGRRLRRASNPASLTLAWPSTAAARPTRAITCCCSVGDGSAVTVRVAGEGSAIGQPNGTSGAEVARVARPGARRALCSQPCETSSTPPRTSRRTERTSSRRSCPAPDGTCARPCSAPSWRRSVWCPRWRPWSPIPTSTGSSRAAAGPRRMVWCSVAMLVLCLWQHLSWLRATAVWHGRRDSDLAAVVAVSWILQLVSYAIALIALVVCVIALFEVGRFATTAVFLVLSLIALLAAQVLAGVQYVRAEGPPGTVRPPEGDADCRSHADRARPDGVDVWRRERDALRFADVGTRSGRARPRASGASTIKLCCPRPGPRSGSRRCGRCR